MLIGMIFFNTELNKPHFLRDEMIFMHCSLQIKQNVYSMGIFSAPVGTQFIVKVFNQRHCVVVLEQDTFILA